MADGRYFENSKMRYLCNRLTDFYKILYHNAY